jgi:hypothetical protein
VSKAKRGIGRLTGKIEPCYYARARASPDWDVVGMLSIPDGSECEWYALEWSVSGVVCVWSGLCQTARSNLKHCTNSTVTHKVVPWSSENTSIRHSLHHHTRSSAIPFPSSAVVVLSGMGELPVCEPDEILVEVAVEVLELDWCGCWREESWGTQLFLVLELWRVCRRISDMNEAPTRCGTCQWDEDDHDAGAPVSHKAQLYNFTSLVRPSSTSLIASRSSSEPLYLRCRGRHHFL